MSRIPLLVMVLAGTAVFSEAAEPAKNISLPASVVPQDGQVPSAASAQANSAAGKESFERHVAQTQEDLRAARARSLPKEMSRLSNELSRITDDVLHMSSDFERLESLEWKMAIIARKIETALDKTQKFPLPASKDPASAEAATDLLGKARDLVSECRRLEIQVPRIRDRIGFSQDGQDFASAAGEAKKNASQLETEAQALLARLN